MIIILTMLIRWNRTLRPRFFRSRLHALVLFIVCACAVVVLASFSHWRTLEQSHAQADAVSLDDQIDVGLERAAREALGSEDGTIIVMDTQTGRLRAVSDP